jgi:arylsulfatase A-like enzyme
VADFVNFIDVAPTLLEAAGATIPEDMSGRSFLNVLADPGSGQIDASRTWTATGLEWHGRATSMSSTTTSRSAR